MLSTPTVSTLPVYIFGETHSGVTPNVYAIATVMLAITLIGFALVGVGLQDLRPREAAGDVSLTDTVAGTARRSRDLDVTGDRRECSVGSSGRDGAAALRQPLNNPDDTP